MAKKITGYIKLQVPAGAANPSPPVGPALGQKGVNIMEFCKAFNAATVEQQKKFPGMKLPVVITVFVDKSFEFVTKLPPASALLKKAANLSKGSTAPGTKSAGKLKMSQIREIAEMKIADMNANNVEAATSMLVGTALSIGIQVVEG